MNEILEIILHTDNAIKAIVADNVIKAYLVLFMIIFAETGTVFFPFLPGDGLLFSAGVIASINRIRDRYSGTIINHCRDFGKSE